MPHWFTRSGKTAPHDPDNDRQSFRVVCDCGESVSGLRSRRYQLVECPACGTDLFVLPADVYPALAETGKKKRKKKRRQRASLPNAVPESPAAPEPDVEPESAAPITAAVEQQADAPQHTGAGQTAAAPADALPAPQPKRPAVTAFRAVMLIVAAVVVLTLWWRLRARALDRAARTAQTAREQGDAALIAGDLPAAAEHFRTAREAIDTLGRDDAWARETIQLGRETEAATHLAVRPLLELIEEAHRALADIPAGEEQPAAVSGALARYAGQWVVLDTTLIPAPASDTSPRWILNYPFTIGNRAVELDATLPVLAPFQSETESPRVLFAAQLAECHLVSGARPALVISFNPHTAFLWSNASTLRHIGFAGNEPVPDELQALLDRQARMMGVTE